MKFPTPLQWCVIWATALLATAVWLDFPGTLQPFDPSHPTSFLWLLVWRRRGESTLVLVALGLLLTWQIPRLDLRATLSRLASRINRKRIAVAALAALGLLGVLWAWKFSTRQDFDFDQFMRERSERAQPTSLR